MKIKITSGCSCGPPSRTPLVSKHQLRQAKKHQNIQIENAHKKKQLMIGALALPVYVAPF